MAGFDESFANILNYSRSEWQKIDLCLANFINSGQDLDWASCVRQEVMDSWMRSRRYGIVPDMDIQTVKVKGSEYKKILDDKKQVIRAAAPVLQKGLPFIERNNPHFNVGVIDCNGIALISGTEWAFSPSSFCGLNLSEEIVGTSSHSLSAFLDKPILLIAPEHYSKALQRVSVASSIPIHDSKEKVSALLTFTYYGDLEQYIGRKEMFSWAIAFQYTIAQEIENNLRTSSEKFFFGSGSNLVDAVMSLSDEGLVAVNNQGDVCHMSNGAEKFLGISLKEAKGKNITEIFSAPFHFNEIQKDTPPESDFTVKIKANGRTKNCTIKTLNLKNNEGMIIRISENKANINKVNNFTAIYTFHNIIAKTQEMIKTKEIATRFAHSACNILLIGESGTGKEMFAHAIHNEYNPPSPFVAINCASIPKGLIESELFGYEGGSFTGADRKGRPGKLEMAHGGTLFLDEIGDMPLELQPVLLRVLEDGRVMRVGGNKYIQVHFRVIAATNKDLNQLVIEKAFREDLYYRLSTLKIIIPPLRNREADIIDLTESLIRKACDKAGIPVLSIDSNAINALQKYSWPGNVRELQNAIYYAVNMASSDVIKMLDLPQEIAIKSKPVITSKKPSKIYELEKEAIQAAMAYSGNNTRKAASILGIGNSTLYRKIKKYKIDCIENLS